MQNNKSIEFQSLAKEENNRLGKLILQKMSVEDYMNDSQDNHPAVYVGTYAKYNDGSLFGMWVDMVKCGDYDTFMEVCHNLHADEEDPELMYYPKSEVIKSSDWFVSDSQHNILATLFLTFHNIPISLGFSTNS